MSREQKRLRRSRFILPRTFLSYHPRDTTGRAQIRSYRNALYPVLVSEAQARVAEKRGYRNLR